MQLVYLSASQQDTPCRVGIPKLYTAERAGRKKTEILDVEPSFQPKILHQVPNFSKLHKALLNESLRKIKSNDTTRCQPFFLRTSSLPTRKRRKSLETLQVRAWLLVEEKAGKLNYLESL